MLHFALDPIFGWSNLPFPSHTQLCSALFVASLCVRHVLYSKYHSADPLIGVCNTARGSPLDRGWYESGGVYAFKTTHCFSATSNAPQVGKKRKLSLDTIPDEEQTTKKSKAEDGSASTAISEGDKSASPEPSQDVTEVTSGVQDVDIKEPLSSDSVPLPEPDASEAEALNENVDQHTEMSEPSVVSESSGSAPDIPAPASAPTAEVISEIVSEAGKAEPKRNREKKSAAPPSTTARPQKPLPKGRKATKPSSKAASKPSSKAAPKHTTSEQNPTPDVAAASGP